MDKLIIEHKKVKDSELRYVVGNNAYMAKMTYDYEFYEIKYDGCLVGYAIRHNILACRNTEYIDICIISNYRNKGIGSIALKHFLDKYCTKDTIAIFSNNKDKSRFLIKNGFEFDDVYIYKNLYKYNKKKDDLNE